MGHTVGCSELNGDQLDAILVHGLGVVVPELRDHVSSCQLCARTLQSLQLTLADIFEMQNTPPNCNCPEASVWYHVAAGTADGSLLLLEHAATCDACAQKLRTASALFADETTAQEEQVVRALPNATPGGRRRLVRMLVPRKASFLAFFPFRSRWIPVFAVIATVLVVAGVHTFRRLREPDPQHLIADAYSEHRVLELRFPGGNHSELAPVQRGTGDLHLGRPALLKAELEIARHDTDRNPLWLQARAEAKLLEWKPESAMQDLQRVVHLINTDVPLLLDLATARFELGEKNDSPEEFAQAEELLSRVLQNHPQNLTALFNRAVVLEKLHLYIQAINDWESYIRVAPNDAWRGEAISRLQAVKKRQAEYDHISNELADPNALFHVPDTLEEAKLQSRFEVYQELVVRQWIATLASHRNEATSKAGLGWISSVSEKAARDHDDVWFDKIVAQSRGSRSPVAFSRLQKALESADSADFATALRLASEAEQLFRKANDAPGAARAGLERVSAMHFANNASACAETAQRLLREFAASRFRWIAIQLQIERGICQNLAGDLDSSLNTLIYAEQNALQYRYDLLAVRARTMQALVAWAQGQRALPWKMLQGDIEGCRTVLCPAMRIYSLYANMDDFAEDSRQWHLEVAIGLQAVHAIGNRSDPLMLAFEFSRMAKAAVLAELPEISKRSSLSADQFLAASPVSQVSLQYRAGIEVELAKLAFDQGDLHRVSSLLSDARPAMASLSDRYLLMDFYATDGRLQLRSHRLQEAEDSISRALNIAERQLADLRSGIDRSRWRRRTDTLFRTAVELSLERNDPSEALELWEAFLGAAFRNTTTQSPVTKLRSSTQQTPLSSFDGVAAMLPHLNVQTVLSFALISDRVAAWVADDRGIFFKWLPGNAESIVAVASRFKDECADQNSAPLAVAQDARLLFNELIAPVLPHLDPRHALLIDGDEQITDLPIQALLDPRGVYVNDLFVLEHTPGLYFLSSARPANISLHRSDPLLAVASSTAGYGESEEENVPLSEAEAEVTAIAHGFIHHTLLVGAKARSEEIRRDIAGAFVFHYVGHATNAGMGGALLHGGEIFTAKDVTNMQLGRLQLVVLSSCATEPGDSNDAPESLKEAFLQAHVPHVVASSWSVDSEATKYFMLQFYRAALSGQSIPEALRTAAGATRAIPKFANPFFWASFSAFGASQS